MSSSSYPTLEALRKLSDGLTSQGKQLLKLEERLAALEQLLRRGPKKGKAGKLTEEEWLARRRQVMAENGLRRWEKNEHAEVSAESSSPAKKRKTAKR